MMTKPHSEQVSIDNTPLYHCMVGCVRRAFCVMMTTKPARISITANNMVSLPLQFDKAFAESWSLEEVVERWLQLYKGDKLIHKYESFGWKYLFVLTPTRSDTGLVKKRVTRFDKGVES